MTGLREIPRSTLMLIALVGVSSLCLFQAMRHEEVEIAPVGGPAPKDLIPLSFPVLRTPQSALYATIAEHSVFNVDHVKDQPPPPPKPPPPPPLENYKLVGVVLSSAERLALVQRKASGDVMRVRSGDTFDGWTVGQIGSGAVQVSAQGLAGTLSIPRAAGRVTIGGTTTFMSATPSFVQ